MNIIMPRKQCYWTRKLELDLVEFVRKRDFIWKPIGNTNHHIQQKYKAYAEFAAKLGRGFTARSVRDRWVNIRSTFNHNLRRVDKSRESARSAADVYVPCWPLWRPLQFLRHVAGKEEGYEAYPSLPDYKDSSIQVKEESPSDIEELSILSIRQRGQRTDRPRRKIKLASKPRNNKCKRVIDDLLKAMAPLVVNPAYNATQGCWFLGRHVTERLNCMREKDAECASREILNVLDSFDIHNDNSHSQIYEDLDSVT